GAARVVSIRLADDAGRAYLAMPVEAVRVGDNTPTGGVIDTPRALLVGPRTIVLDNGAPSVLIVPHESTRVLHGGRMTIDYIGPAGSFSPVTYSLGDVLAGRLSADKFRDKYVLIGP